MSHFLPSDSSRQAFALTRWSIVLTAGGAEANTARQRALEELARTYWFPLYAFLRRNGQAPEGAEDLTQGFFAHLIEKQALQRVEPSQGKFRSFLLASLKHFLLNDYDRAQAQKRGGGLRILPLDAGNAEEQYRVEPVDAMTPERLFERRWAWAVLDRAMLRLRTKYEEEGKGNLFGALKGALLRRLEAGEYDAIAATLEMEPATVAVAAHRLRRRYRQCLRDEIAQTVASPDLIDEEVQYLLDCL